MKSLDWPRLCSASWPRMNASSWCRRYFYFSLDHLKCLAVFVPTQRMETVCWAGVVPVCCSTHVNRSLTNQKRIQFVNGARRLVICLFMKELTTSSVDGPTSIKTLDSHCQGLLTEREGSSWFLPDLASLTFPAFQNPLATLGFRRLERICL